jgi:hypothetical protein
MIKVSLFLESHLQLCILFLYSSFMQRKLSLQGEMQQLRDKLAIAERAARSEAQVKVKMAIMFNFELSF